MYGVTARYVTFAADFPLRCFLRRLGGRRLRRTEVKPPPYLSSPSLAYLVAPHPISTAIPPGGLASPGFWILPPGAAIAWYSRSQRPFQRHNRLAQWVIVSRDLGNYDSRGQSSQQELL